LLTTYGQSKKGSTGQPLVEVDMIYLTIPGKERVKEYEKDQQLWPTRRREEKKSDTGGDLGSDKKINFNGQVGGQMNSIWARNSKANLTQGREG